VAGIPFWTGPARHIRGLAIPRPGALPDTARFRWTGRRDTKSGVFFFAAGLFCLPGGHSSFFCREQLLLFLVLQQKMFPARRLRATYWPCRLFLRTMTFPVCVLVPFSFLVLLGSIDQIVQGPPPALSPQIGPCPAVSRAKAFSGGPRELHVTFYSWTRNLDCAVSQR